MISWWECLPSGFIGAYGALLACWVPRGAKPYCGALCGRPSGVFGTVVWRPGCSGERITPLTGRSW